MRGLSRDIAVRLAQAPADARQQVAMQTAIDLAATRLPEIRILAGEAWSEFEYWACQVNVARSRGRRREMYEAVGVDYMAPLPAQVDYDAAIAFGYAMRCCQEVSDLDGLEPVALSAGPLTRAESSTAAIDDLDATVKRPTLGVRAEPEFDPLDATDADPRSAAQDLLMCAEAIFVDIRAPSRLGVAINTLVLRGFGVEEGHPQYGAAVGATLFGYAVRMAQAEWRPLTAYEADDVEMLLSRTGGGALDYELMADDADALGGLLEYVAGLADDQMGVLRLLHVPLEVWDHFAALAVEQLHRNLRRNGLKRRLLPPADGIENLIRLGCAIRIVDEIAGEVPLPASAL